MSETSSSAATRAKFSRGVRVALWASIATGALTVLKYAVGVLYDAPLLVADAFHSMTDTAAIAASAFGLYLAGRSHSSRFPHGLYKAETLASLFIGLFITAAGADLLIDGYRSLGASTGETGLPTVPLLVMALSIVTAIVIALLELRASRAINSLSLEANARESILDVASSIVVLGGLILSSLRIGYVEGAIIMLVAVLILKTGIESTVRSVLILLDAVMERELTEQLRESLTRVRGVKGVISVFVRMAGPVRIVETAVEIQPSATVKSAGDIAAKIRHYIQDNFENIETVFVDLRPAMSETLRAIMPVMEMKGGRSPVHAHFGRAPCYAIITIGPESYEIEDFYLNEYLELSLHVGLKVVKALAHYNIDVLFTSQIGEIAYYILKDNLVTIYRIPEGDLNLEEVIALFRGKKLPPVTGPTHASEGG